MNLTSLPNTEATADTFASRWAERTADAPRRAIASGPAASISFAYGLPDLSLFPTAELTAATEQVMREQHAFALQYGNVRGSAPLLQLLREKFRRDENLDLATENCMITSGSSQAISLVLRAALEPGDVVLCEAPTFVGALGMIIRNEGRPVGVPMDDQGMDINEAEKTLEELAGRGIKPKVIYTIPTFHNPMGVTMPLARRVALLELARRYDLLVIEDDAYSDLAFDVKPPASMLSLDSDGRVIRVGTFSKILAAGMRLGWAMGAPGAINRLMRVKDDGGTNPFAAYVAAAFMQAGHLEPLIATYTDAYRQKRDVALAALARYMPQGVSWTRPGGGFFIWVELPEQLNAADLLALAREEGVDYLPGADCFPRGTGGRNAFRLSFSTPTVDEVEEGVKRLGHCVTAAL